MTSAWVVIEDDVFRFLPDSTEKLRAFGVQVAEKGPRKSPSATWWLLEFEPGYYAYPDEDREILPLTYSLDETGKLRVTGPGGTITDPS